MLGASSLLGTLGVCSGEMERGPFFFLSIPSLTTIIPLLSLSLPCFYVLVPCPPSASFSSLPSFLLSFSDSPRISPLFGSHFLMVSHPSKCCLGPLMPDPGKGQMGHMAVCNQGSTPGKGWPSVMLSPKGQSVSQLSLRRGRVREEANIH